MVAAKRRLERSSFEPIKILAFVEADYVTGPAKPLLAFGEQMRNPPIEWGLRRVTLSIATFCRGNTESNAFIDAVRQADIPVHIIRERYRFDLDARRQMRELIDREDPDLIETHSVKSHFLLHSVGRGNRPWVAFHHGYTTPNLKMRLYNQLDRWTLRSADAVITVCMPFKKDLEDKGVQRERLHVLHNFETPSIAPDATVLARLREEFQLGEAPVILTMGRMSQEKGHLVLIQALKHLREIRPELDWVLLLVGTGPELESVTQAVAEAGLAARVRFAGQQEHPMRFFHLADILALPSLSEGSPLVVLEALAAGLPIAATAVGGVPEIVTNGESALLTPARDAKAMAGSIATLLEDPIGARMRSDRGLVDLKERFSPEVYMRTLVNLFEKLLP